MLVTEWDFDLEKKVLQKEAWEDGFEEGEERGMKRGALKTAKALRAEGVDVNTIARATGLTVDDILKL